MFTVRKVAYLQIKSGAISIIFRIATPTSKLLLKTRLNPPPSMVMVHRLRLTLSPLQVSPLSPRALHLIASVVVLANATISESLLATFLSLVADPVPGNRSRLLRLAVHPHRGVRPPGDHCRLVGPLRLLRGEAPPVEPLRLLRGETRHGEPLRLLRGLPPAGPLSPTQRRVAPKRSSPSQRVSADPAHGSSSSKRPLSGGSQSRKRSSRDSLSPRRGSPPPKRRRQEERDSVSPPTQHSSRASSREPSQERPGSRSPPLQASPSREEKEADDAPIPATVKAMVEFIRSNFPDAIASPAQKSSRSFDLSASVGVTDPAAPSGSLLGWSQVMSDSFADTQKKFSKRIQEGRACHTLLPSLHRLEKVANSPSQGKELIANPDVLDLLRNKVPDFRHLPISVKEGIALERTLRSIMESQSFLTWSVMGLLKSLHLKSLLPKDNPVISQLQKSFSKACSNVASGMTAGAAFLTMKRQHLLLSHVVPSVSEAQKRNLLADPFFQTSSLFDASSLESARSAARDMSLFKPHLKASTSSSQSRRQGPSSASSRRGSARQFSGPSSSQRASSPFRQQSAKKGDARFHKKSSGTPQKRGGFRK